MDDLSKALEAFKKLDKNEVNFLLRRLLAEEKVDIPALITSYAQYLADFRHAAQNDIRKLAEAGLELGTKEIKKIPTIKNPKSHDKKGLYTALAHTLLAAGYRDTAFNKKLSETLDMSIVGVDWYNHSWALETIPESKLKPKEQS